MGSRIRALRDSVGISQAKFGAGFGVSREAVSQWEKGKSTPEQDKLEKMAERYDVSLDWIAGKGPDQRMSKPQGDVQAVDNTQRMVAGPNISTIAYQGGEKGLSSWNRDVPILGHAKAGIEGFFLDNGEILGMAYRHPGQVGVKGAFAVYVRDESMIPAFKPGRVAWVHPSRPCTLGDDVLIELVDGQAFIKEYKRKTAEHLICRQWNPEKDVRFDIKKIKHIYLILGSYREE